MSKLENKTSPIWLVDDNEDERFMAEHCHGESGLRNPMVQMSSGQALVERMKSTIENGQPRPGMLLLDINMPQMDGFECLSWVRQLQELDDDLEVVMLTNSDNPTDMDRAKALGASGYQVKPTDLVEYTNFFQELADE